MTGPGVPVQGSEGGGGVHALAGIPVAVAEAARPVSVAVDDGCAAVGNGDGGRVRVVGAPGTAGAAQPASNPNKSNAARTKITVIVVFILRPCLTTLQEISAIR